MAMSPVKPGRAGPSECFGALPEGYWCSQRNLDAPEHATDRWRTASGGSNATRNHTCHVRTLGLNP
eukprot:8291691-Pyramimonas_sp.AAC.1